MWGLGCGGVILRQWLAVTCWGLGSTWLGHVQTTGLGHFGGGRLYRAMIRSEVPRSTRQGATQDTLRLVAKTIVAQIARVLWGCLDPSRVPWG